MRRLLSGVAMGGLAILTAACGGDDNADSAQPAPVVTTPTAPPTPTPSPTPTPTPAPASYVSTCDFTRNQAFNLLFGTEVRAKGAFTSPNDYIYSSASTAVVDVGTNSTVRVDAASGDATLVLNGATLAAVTGSQREAPFPGDEGVTYILGANQFGFGCVPAKLALAYTVSVGYGTNIPDPAPGATDTSNQILIGGSPTISSGELSSGSYSSVVSLAVLFTGTSSRTDAADGTTVTPVTFDASSGVLRGTLISNGDQSYTITFTATVTPGTTRFQGTATTASGATGKISGGFFGPGGSEYGFVLAIDDGSAHLAGVSVGKR